MTFIPPSRYPRASDDDDDSDDVKHDDILVISTNNANSETNRARNQTFTNMRIFVIHRTQPRRSPVESTREIPNDHRSSSSTANPRPRAGFDANERRRDGTLR